MPTKINFIADGKTISIPKADTIFNLQLFKISPSLTYSKTKLIANMVNVPTQVNFDGVTYPANTLAYLTFPYSLSQVKDYANEHNIRLGRWLFQAGKEHIDIHDDVIVNHTFVNMTGQNETYRAVSTLDKSFYAFKIINDEIRVYFVKSEANKLSGNITFALNSWVVGEGGNAWSGNSSYNNFMLDRNTNHIILPDAVTDGLVMYHKMSGSSGITSYDMNTTSNNNGTLTNMSTGLDNGSSGWNSSGKFGNAIAFDGTNDYVNAGNAASLNITGAITAEAWIKGEAQDDKVILSKYENALGSYRSWTIGSEQIGLTGGNTKLKVTVSADGGTTNDKRYTSSVVVMNNVWHHTAFTFTSNNLSIYVDGVLDTSPTKSDDKPVTTIYATDAPVRVGAVNSVPLAFFKGSIDEVRIYNRALTNNEINQTMINTMLTSSNLITWHDAGAGYQTYQIDINATAQTNSNYSAFYRTNGTGAWAEIGTPNSTGNQSITLPVTYQNTDLKVELYGNGTATPEIIKTTFWTGVSDLVLSGYVTNQLGLYLLNARVDFDNKYNFTDSAGYYEFTGVSNKQYSILARAIGYKNYTDTLTIVSNTTKNMTLSERTSGTVSMPGFSAISGIFILALTIILIKKKRR